MFNYLKARLANLATSSTWFVCVLGVIALYLVGAVLIGIHLSQAPSQVGIDKIIERARIDSSAPAIGTATVETLVFVIETLLEKRGGYLSNDVTLPGLWLDNMPNWEFGALVQSRDLARALRKDFSRSQSQSTEDIDLVVAEPALNYDSEKWFPSAESSYSKSAEAARSFGNRLATQGENAQFYARADNLRNYLANVETRLGSLSQRLSASVGQIRFNTDFMRDPNVNQSIENLTERRVKTPWFEIDDVFFESRGSAWALLHILRAIEHDFASVLENKNARISLRQVIRELESTQQTVWSPMILNGSGFGLFANHSLVMASYISRAHTALSDLRALLSQG
ncbi:DUF2333 family protein [Litorivicinus sp.]|jgi:hypothetical protein|nr:DUF2333 family protein [Litorivicinus sp.]|tara:strand:+ start:22400 stop:23419 length:1020 start_codon:yes stop_codon:yes gene_type:complete